MTRSDMRKLVETVAKKLRGQKRIPVSRKKLARQSHSMQADLSFDSDDKITPAVAYKAFMDYARTRDWNWFYLASDAWPQYWSKDVLVEKSGPVTGCLQYSFYNDKMLARLTVFGGAEWYQ